MLREERSDTELVLAARGDDRTAFGELFDRWFDRAWNVARTIVRDDDLAADVAQDALLGAWQQLDQLRNPDAFGGWLLRSTRNRALSRLARERRSTASGDEIVSGLRDRGGHDPVGAERLPEPDAASEARDRQDLVWAAAAALGEGDASLLDLHLRHGLTPAEIADELGVAANTAHQQLFRLRTRLGDAIGSYMLWRNGRPLCDGLAEAVSGRKAFNRSVARAIRRHQKSCERCAEEREKLVDPAKLFAGVPLVGVPVGLKAQAAAALAEAGVPVGAGAGGGGAATDPGSPSANGGEAGGTGGETGGSGGESGGTGDAGGSSSGGEISSPSGGAGNGGAAPDGAGGGTGGEAGGPAPADAPAPLDATSTTEFTEHVEPGPGSPGTSPSMPTSLPIAKGAGTGNRLLLSVGAGLTVVVAVLGLILFLQQGDDDGPSLAAIQSNPTDLNGDLPAAGQEGSGGPDPAGPASFSPGSDDDSTSSTATSTELAASSSTTDGSPTSSSTSSSSSTSTSTTRETTSSSTTETTRPSSTSSTNPSTTPTTTETTATTGTTSTSTSTPPHDPPEIVRFTAVAGSPTRECAVTQELPYRISWATENATAVTLQHGNESTTSKPNGSISICGNKGDPVILVATGPGGEDKRQITL